MSRRPSMGYKLKTLMKKGPVVCPGIFSPILARLAEAAGFEAGYVSGAGLHAREALSDTGKLSREDVVFAAGRIARAARIPLIVDADTGFGDVHAIPQTARLFERTGAAGIQIEDQRFPKRCGHLPGKELVTADEMAAKIKQAAKARTDRHFLIVARTDARGVTGFDDAVARARRYKEAGADVVFPEALESADEFDRFARLIPGPLLANMTEFGKTPYLTVEDFGRMGYGLVIFPMTLFRAMMRTAEETLQTLKTQGTQRPLLEKMQTREEFYRLIGYEVEPPDTSGGA